MAYIQPKRDAAHLSPLEDELEYPERFYSPVIIVILLDNLSNAHWLQQPYQAHARSKKSFYHVTRISNFHHLI